MSDETRVRLKPDFLFVMMTPAPGNPCASTVRDKSGDGAGRNLGTNYAGHGQLQREEYQDCFFMYGSPIGTVSGNH